jgi:hypothetical protein
VYNRPFFIHDADGYTKAWYTENQGWSEEELTAVDVTETLTVLPRPALPPHNGYGTLEDRRAQQ